MRYLPDWFPSTIFGKTAQQRRALDDNMSEALFKRIRRTKFRDPLLLQRPRLNRRTNAGRGYRITSATVENVTLHKWANSSDGAAFLRLEGDCNRFCQVGVDPLKHGSPPKRLLQ